MPPSPKFAHPADYPSLSEQEIIIVKKVYDFTEDFFSNPQFDASHDFNHIKRVVANSLTILDKEEELQKRSCLPALNPLSVILGALLHDVEDKKYRSADDTTSPTKQILNQVGLTDDYADLMLQLVHGVSYSSEVKDPEKVIRAIQLIPELAIVQDADRLDAIGAIGIGRCFTFSGAKKIPDMQDSIAHFEDKLIKLRDMMKTETGRLLAEERTDRILEFMSWWQDETAATTT
ncbi:hypothetical protein B0A52_09147 [Exophiala mesophila]|uniref:HD/PDEase domain-containing protein n=1 Tax=Exophiala mesophila TaxID=212818 RepID=A0A438MW66_EXOME|nr:hypothetical protein B0A52_09147 [Exophiala mesophila]